MRRYDSWRVILLGLTAFGLIAGFVRFQDVIRWKMDQYWVYLRGMVNPVAAVPTPNLPVVQATNVPPIEIPSEQPTSTSTEVRSSAPTPFPTPLPNEVQLAAPAWEKQDLNNCGPATLAMYLRYYGWGGDQRDIAETMKPERGDRNVNVEELVYYVRNNAGWLKVDYRVGGNIDQLRQLLAAGFPVMVEKGFYVEESYWPNDDRWAGHYILVAGYS